MLRRITAPSHRPFLDSLADGVVALLSADDDPPPRRALQPIGVPVGSDRYYEQPTYLRLGLRIPELDAGA